MGRPRHASGRGRVGGCRPARRRRSGRPCGQPPDSARGHSGANGEHGMAVGLEGLDKDAVAPLDGHGDWFRALSGQGRHQVVDAGSVVGEPLVQLDVAGGGEHGELVSVTSPVHPCEHGHCFASFGAGATPRRRARPGRSSRRSKRYSQWPVQSSPPAGGTGLPTDLEGHAAKALSRRRGVTSGTLPPVGDASTARRRRGGWCTDERCQEAPSITRSIDARSPSWASEMTRRTPASPRALSERKNAVQNALSSLSPTARPRTSRLPSAATPVATTMALDTTRAPSWA